MIFLCKGIRYSSGSAQRCFFGIPTAHVIFLTIVDKVGDYVLDLLVIHQSAQKYLRAQTLRHCQPLIEASAAAAAAKSLQSCLTLCDPIDGSPPGSPVPGILQARTLEWVAISFSSAWKWKVKVKSLSRVQLFATPWTAAYQAPLSMGFSR